MGGKADRIRGYSPGLSGPLPGGASARMPEIPITALRYYLPRVWREWKARSFPAHEIRSWGGNGCAVDIIALSAPEEFRKTASEFTGYHRGTFGDRFGAQLTRKFKL